MSRPKSLQQCKSGKHFVVYSERQGAEIREGRRHTIIKTEKGSVAVPRHGNKDLATGTWHAVYKGLIAIGITFLLLFCGGSAIIPESAYEGAIDIAAPLFEALEWVIAFATS